jgi:hypothetical protein
MEKLPAHGGSKAERENIKTILETAADESFRK